MLYLVQNLFSNNKEHRTISLNTHYMVVFKNPRDATSMSHLARQMYPGRTKFALDAFKDATSEPHGYLLIDLKQDTSEDMRLRTCIFPDYDLQYVYLSKNKKIEHANRLFIRTMSALVKRHILCIQALNRCKSAKLRRAIIANADADLLCALAECAYNILKKNIPLTALQRRHLNKYRTNLRKLSQRRTSAAERRRLLLRSQVGEGQSGGFLSAFLAPLASSVFLFLLREVLLKK